MISLIRKLFFTLIDIHGREVVAPVNFIESKVVVDVSELVSGMYVVKVEIEGEDAMVWRVVKN